IVMVIATPIKRTGGAGGMQSTARLVGQTLGATVVTVVFALLPAPSKPVGTCLYIALGAAIVAGLFSISRAGKIKQ
ncbi:MAG: MFS transporter, partial [Muribaculaceae bacterium]|nr:MFS transporter [Muribaculaceae bacterium]